MMNDEGKDRATGDTETSSSTSTKTDVKKRRSALNSTLSAQAKKSVNPPGHGTEKKTPDSGSSSDDASAFDAIDIKAPEHMHTPRSDDSLRIVMLEQIIEGDNPRTMIDEDEYETFLNSVKELGINQPVLCRYAPPGSGADYQIVAGHRRFRAAKESKLSSIPILVRDMSDTDAFVFAVAENTNRDALPPRDLLISYERLVELNVPQKDIVAAIGGAAKTSKLKKIAESKYWREQVLYNDVSVRSAYEGAVSESKTESRPFLDGDEAGAPNPLDMSEDEEAYGDDEDTGMTEISDDLPDPDKEKPKKLKCLEATYIDPQGQHHLGYINISEVNFEGESARYTAWYSKDGSDHRSVSLDELKLHRGFVLK